MPRRAALSDVERELKVPCADRMAVRRALSALGGRCKGEGLEHNVVFDSADGALRRKDVLLRLRCWKGNVLTYKGPRKGSRGKSKSRDEIEVELPDLAAMERILTSLGYQRTWVYEKLTEKWVLDDAMISIDTLPLAGDWVEVEAASERRIREVFREIGLGTGRATSATYAEIFADYLNKRGEDFRDMIFEDKEQA